MCRVCGLVWTNPRPSDAEIDRYYASSYRLDYAKQHVPSRRKVLRGLIGSEERRRAFASDLPRGARVLDVGCGAGEFVYLLRRHGLEASGVEPGEEFSEFSRQVLGIPIQTATVETAVVPAQSQRLITMFHMLEHAAEPLKTLATIRGWMDPDSGRLVVEVPNIASTVQAPAHRFHYAHLHGFTAGTLAAMGTAAGLAPVATRHSDDGGNVMCIFAVGVLPDGPLAPLPDVVAKLRGVFREHTTLRHYLTPRPYQRAVHRLTRRLREDRMLSRLPSIETILAQFRGERTNL